MKGRRKEFNIRDDQIGCYWPERSLVGLHGGARGCNVAAGPFANSDFANSENVVRMTGIVDSNVLDNE